ncbi:hypothetical protein SAMN05192583_0053 [Sphingomonas gellani]|uniref:Uncharacterized protein n=1 Tax=Sphingomonas gellani TaxID=1166340 RepID=A0A1H7Y1H0_9SPHN|nr:hypothetical protein [Sphingomonas gellani]SEM40046.1 hypothetical protein SAMN05192583_0053 [Sphingomonas gellani]
MTLTFKQRYKAEYDALKNAIDRCYRPSHPQYDDYGGRGITVADEWLDPQTGFQCFFDHIGPKPTPQHTLDRIDNDNGYVPGEPSNVRWATRSEQSANRRPQRLKGDLGWGMGRYSYLDKHGYRRTQSSPLITLEDRTQTLMAWAQELGLDTATLRQRFERGWSADRALVATLYNPHGNPRIN